MLHESAQLVPHAAMAMLPGNKDDVLARLIRAVVEDPPQALAAVGVATCATVVRAGAALRVGGGRVWLLGPLLVACFFGGEGAMLASVWVGADVHRRRATGHIVLAVAVVNL